MTTVIFDPAAELALLTLPPADALRIVDAIDHFAHTGVGFVRRMLDGSGQARLYVADHYVMFEIDSSALRVLAIRARASGRGG